MSQFSLDNTLAKVSNYNATTERHGDEIVPVGDLKLEVAGSNVILNAFGAGYRTFLYRQPHVGDQPPLVNQTPDNLTSLQHPNLAPLELDEDFPGYTLSIGSGLGITEPLVLKDVKLSAFKFRSLDGGTVVVSFNARAKPSPDQSGLLHYLVKQEIEITLTPPSASPQQQLPTGGTGDTLDAQDAEEAAAETKRLADLGQAA